MEKIKIWNSDLQVSRLCMGGCPMGGYGWGQVSFDDMQQAIIMAIDRGVNFFDTADIYGFGRSEELLGQTVLNMRNMVVIATKFGVRLNNEGKTVYDNSPEWIEEALINSLRRLKTDFIDIYQIHYRDSKTPIEVVVDKLVQLQKKGLIRYIGLSNIYLKDIQEIENFKEYFISFQNEYSLANRSYEKDIQGVSNKLGITPMTWGSLGQGILTGKYDRKSTFNSDDRRSREIYKNFHGTKLLHNLDIVDTLRRIAEDYHTSPASVAIRFILDYLPKSVVIAGIKNTNQLKSNLESMDWSLSINQINALLDISKDKLEN